MLDNMSQRKHDTLRTSICIKARVCCSVCIQQTWKTCGGVHQTSGLIRRQDDTDVSQIHCPVHALHFGKAKWNVNRMITLWFALVVSCVIRQRPMCNFTKMISNQAQISWDTLETSWCSVSVYLFQQICERKCLSMPIIRCCLLLHASPQPKI